MTEHDGPGVDGSGDEQEVRDLLAALGRTPDTPAEPLPDDVAARLDDLLGDLVAARAAAPVVPLASRRSRSRGWLAAAGIAASVVLATVILPAMLGSDPAPTAETASTAESAVVELPSRAPLTGAPVLHTATLEADVVDLLDSLPSPLPHTTAQRNGATAADDQPPAEELDAVPYSDNAADTCTWDGPGTAYDVTLDDRRALAVVTLRGDGDHHVRLLVCAPDSGPVEVATVQVPAS